MVGLVVTAGPPDIGEGHIYLLPMNYHSVDAGTWALLGDINMYCGSSFANTASSAQNDALTFKVAFATGTYQFVLWTSTDNQCGILTVKIDGTSIGTIDTYTAGTVYNDRKTIADIPITAGVKSVQFIMATKNVASAAYRLYPLAFAFYRTA